VTAAHSMQAKMLRRLLEVGSTENIRKSLEKIHPSDIVIIFSELQASEQERLLQILFSIKKAGKVLREMPEYLLPEVFPDIDDKKLATMLGNLQPDDAHFLLENMEEERQHAILELIPAPTRQYLEQLLLYPEDSAGSIMNVHAPKITEGMTAQGTIEHLRANREERGIFYIYVVDEDQRLSGILNLRDLLFAKSETPVEELMNREALTVGPEEDKEKVAQFFAKYNLLSMPVVDESRKLLGVITVDDVIDIVKEEATEDIYYMAGLSEPDRAFSSLGESVRRRLPWMALNLGTALLGALVIGYFQESIVKAVALAVFLPVVAQLSGNVGIQTLTVITRSIALGELEFASAAQAILKEMGTGLMLGLIMGLAVGGVGYLWIGNMYLGIILSCALVMAMVLGGTLGAVIPLAMRQLHIDPAMGSGVVVVAITDVFSFLTFLGLGTVLLDQLM
jgi:magnesium transporter